MVRIRVVEEDFAPEAGLAGLDERLFDTPSALARIWHGFAWERHITVSAEDTADPNGRPLTFRWSLLQGQPDRVRITPLDPDGKRALLSVRWHDSFDVPGAEGPRATSRVDIGVFASNGVEQSAPAIVSVSFPTHQARRYGPAADGAMELLSIDYDAAGREVPFDPILHWSAPWTDEPIRDPAGDITGWTRTGRDGSIRTVADDAAGPPVYRIDRRRPDRPVLVEDNP
jgi:hypothetical protein